MDPKQGGQIMASGLFDSYILDALRSIDRTLKRIAVTLEDKSERVDVNYFRHTDSDGDADDR